MSIPSWINISALDCTLDIFNSYTNTTIFTCTLTSVRTHCTIIIPKFKDKSLNLLKTSVSFIPNEFISIFWNNQYIKFYISILINLIISSYFTDLKFETRHLDASKTSPSNCLYRHLALICKYIRFLNIIILTTRFCIYTLNTHINWLYWL